MNLRPILALCVTVLAMSSLHAGDLYVAHELSVADLSAGNTFEVVGRIDSLLGSQLELQGSDAAFQLDDTTARKVLRLDDPEAPIVLSGIVTSTSPKFVVEARSVEGAPEPREVAERLPLTSPLESRRELARLAWFLEEARLTTTVGPELARERFTQLLAAFEKVASKSATDLMALLEITHETLGETDPWIEGAGRVANRFGAEEEIAVRLKTLGFVLDGTRWRLEREVLHDLGLIRDGESIITIERKELRERADLWYTNSSSVALLRSLPDTRYEAAARRGELKNGMARIEALQAKGYPADVTFEYREGHKVEAWNYSRGAIFFCDGLLFDHHWN